MYKLIKVGDLANIQFKEYLFNSYTDMINFDTNLLNFADKAKVVSTGKNYILNSSKNWILQSSSNSGNTDLSDYYTKEEINDLIDGGTAELLEIKLPLYGHVATEIPTSINLDENSWDNVISVNTDMNNGEYPNVLLTFFAGDTGFNTEIGTTIYQTVVKPKQFIVEIDNENVGMFTLDVTVVDGVQISIIADDLTSADRTVTFIQKSYYSKDEVDADINTVSQGIINVRASITAINEDISMTSGSMKIPRANSLGKIDSDYLAIATDAEFETGTSTTIIPNVAQIKNALSDINTIYVGMTVITNGSSTIIANTNTVYSFGTVRYISLILPDIANNSTENKVIVNFRSGSTATVFTYPTDTIQPFIPTIIKTYTHYSFTFEYVINKWIMREPYFSQNVLGEFLVFGVHADFANNLFERIGDSENIQAGEDYNEMNAFGGRKRCNVADDGTINSYYGDPTYIEDGSNGQVMVYQPKFYYMVEPLVTTDIANGNGKHLREANYYICDGPKTGFKLHPAFIDNNGNEREYVLESAFEACAYDTSEAIYLLNDENFTSSEDKLSSIANAKPISGDSHTFTRNVARAMANNRGDNWSLLTIQIASMTQYLMMIEQASFNTQTSIGIGVTNKPRGTGNNSEITGATSELGNETGISSTENNYNAISYRGQENPYGNIWKWVDGINIKGEGVHEAYICSNGNFDDISPSGTANYSNVPFTIAKNNNYISAFGYAEGYDWLFLPSECNGNSSLPVGDCLYQKNTSSSALVASLGGDWISESSAGGFGWFASYSSSHSFCFVGARLVYATNSTIN